MKTEQLNPGVSLRTPDASCKLLCLAVSRIPGVTITRRNRSMWFLSVRSAEFTFRGFQFTIEPDEWDGAYWILSKDGQSHEPEMHQIQSALDAFVGRKAPVA